MAAPIEKICWACSSTIKARTYRLFSSSPTNISVEQYKDVLALLSVTPEGYCCHLCVNKLNRLKKLQTDEDTVVERLRIEKRGLVATFLKLPGLVKLRSLAQPGSSHKKTPNGMYDPPN